MKNKFIRAVSLVVSVAMLLGCAVILSSCNLLEKTPTADDILDLDREERAYALYRYADRRMNSADSYTVDSVYNTSITVGDEVVVSEGVDKTYVSGTRSEAFSEHTDSTTTLRFAEGTEPITEVKTVTGYKDGMYYRKNISGGTTQALCSEMTRTEYTDHKKFLGAFEVDLSEDACFTTTCTYNEDGTWVATYTDFFEEALRGFEGLTAGVSALFPEGVKLSDVVAEIKVNELFYVEYLSFEFIYSGADAGLPSFDVTLSYSDYNETEAFDVDLSEYTEVDDIRIIDKTDKAINSVIDKSRVDFSSQHNQKITYSGESEIIKQKYEGSFGNGESGFVYDITFTDDDASQKILTYRSGKQTVYEVTEDEESGDVLHREIGVFESNDSEAKMLVNNIYDVGIFYALYITDVEEKTANKTYVLTDPLPDTSAYDHILTVTGEEEWAVSTATYTVELEGGKIKTFTYDLTLNTANDDSGIAVRLRTVTEFK